MLLYNYILVEVNMYGISVLELCCVFAYKNMNKTFQFLKSMLSIFIPGLPHVGKKGKMMEEDATRPYSCPFFAIRSFFQSVL